MYLASQKLAGSPTVSATTVEPESEAPLLLLVEDHEDTREMYRYVLEKEGYRISSAVDGDEAIQMAIGLRPNLILMDSVLPRIDGVMAATSIRQIEGMQKVPIIFVSGQAEPHSRTAALAAGGNEYLVKPVSLAQLKATVALQLFMQVGLSTLAVAS